MNSDISERERERKRKTSLLVLDWSSRRPYGPEQVQHLAARHRRGRTTTEAVNNSMWDWIRPSVGRCFPGVGVYHGCGWQAPTVRKMSAVHLSQGWKTGSARRCPACLQLVEAPAGQSCNLTSADYNKMGCIKKRLQVSWTFVCVCFQPHLTPDLLIEVALNSTFGR